VNDKLQGSAATHLQYGGDVSNQVKKGLLLSLSVKKIKIGEYLSELQARTWLSCALCVESGRCNFFGGGSLCQL